MASLLSASVSPDEEQGRGFARILLRGDLPAEPSLTFSIKQGGMTLGPDGWQSAEHPWRPDVVESTPEGAVLRVGPAVVRHMDNGNYRIEVALPGVAPLAAGLTWRDIPPPPDTQRSGGRRRGGVAIGAAPERTRVTEDGLLAPLEAAPPPEPVPPPPAPTPRSAPVPPPQPKPRRVPRWTVAASLALILAIAGSGAYFAFHEPISVPPGPVPPGPVPPGPVPPGPVPPGPVPPLQQAREALKDPNLSVEAALDLAQRLRGDPNAVDATFLLLDYAAEKGSAQAAYEVARFYDPLDSGPSGTIRKKASLACKGYRKAKTAGIADSGYRLDALKQWAEWKAAQGDADAQQTLGCL